MATLPRYQNMGVQYADLPRLSTAGLEQSAKAYDVMGNMLDRMASFAFDRAVTQTQKDAIKYAIENPMTKEQVDTALQTDDGVNLPGAGRIFQDTWQQTQAQLLGTELQLEGQRKLSSVATMIESGAPVNLQAIQSEINDMIDGYSSTVMALDPDQALKLRASLSTAGNALYQKAATQAIKQQQLEYKARFEQAIPEVQPVIEALISKAGTIDPETGKPIDVEGLIEIQRQPFMASIRLTGETKYIDGFNKMVQEAKMGALTGYMIDRTVTPDASTAVNKINAGDFGNLSGVYAGMSQEDKDKVRKNVLESFSAEYQANNQARLAKEAENKQAWSELSIEFIRPGTSWKRKREIVNEGLALGQITVTTAESLLRPPESSETARANPTLYVSINDDIQRGRINNIAQLEQYRGRLSNAEYKALGTAVTSSQGRLANQRINAHAGIQENAWVTEKSASIKSRTQQLYMEELERQVPGPNGVLVYQTPVEAADAAIRRYGEDKLIRSETQVQEANQRKIEEVLTRNGITLNMPIENLDVEQLKVGKGDKENLRGWVDAYKKSVKRMAGQ